MRNILILSLTLILSNASINANSLKDSCLKDGGQMVNSLTCPTSGKVRTGQFCVVEEDLFYNGCNFSQISEFGNVFFPACRLHDHCYHHEPASSGLSKKQCDKRFLSNMNKICEGRKDEKRCKSRASLFYRAVRFFGKKSWKCSNVDANYPVYL